MRFTARQGWRPMGSRSTLSCRSAGPAPRGQCLLQLFRLRQGSATATRTNAPGATATTGNGGYNVPACYVAGANSCNCADFNSRSQAQWFHDAYDPADVNRLDTDHDGVECESLPG